MRVFVAYGYTAPELWVRDFVLPVLQALEIDVLDGQEIVGERIDDEVHRRIESADALIGFLQRRDRYADDTWDSSQYVKDEIGHAIDKQKPVVQVVETGVRDPGGTRQGRQLLRYDAAARDRFLVELTKHVREWIQGVVSVRLAPDALIRELDLIGPDSLPACSFKIRHLSHVEREGQVPITGEGGGLYVRLVGFRPGRVVELSIQTTGRRWWCRGIRYTNPFVTMHLE